MQSGGYAVDQNQERQESLSEMGGLAARIATDIGAVRRRLIMINSALTGGAPTADGNAGPKPVPSGMVGMLGGSLYEMSNSLAHIDDEIGRISFALGIDQPPQGGRG